MAGTIVNWSGTITTTEGLTQCLELPAERSQDLCTLYQYDALGNTLVVTDALGTMTRSFYDSLGRLEATVSNWDPASLSSPDDCALSPSNQSGENLCTLYGYDAAGRQISTTNALSQTSLTVYDAAGRPFISVANWDGSAIDEPGDCDFGPGSEQNLCTITAYDSLGRRVSVTDPMSNTTRFQYDGLGLSLIHI